MTNPLSGYAYSVYLQREASPNGSRWDDIRKDSGRTGWNITPRWVTTAEPRGISRRMSGRENRFLYYEWTLSYHLRFTDITCELFRGLLESYDFANDLDDSVELKTYLPNLAYDVNTHAMWLVNAEQDKTIFLQGVVVAGAEVSITNRNIAQVFFRGAALDMNVGDSLLNPPTHKPDTVDRRPYCPAQYCNAYLTRDDFEIPLSDYRVPNVTSMSLRLDRSLSPASYGRQTRAGAWIQDGGVNGYSEIQLRTKPDNLEELDTPDFTGALVLQFGESSERFLEGLFPKANLTLTDLTPQNGQTEVTHMLNAYAIDNMTEDAGVALRLLRDEDGYDGGEAGVTDNYTTAGIDGGNAGDVMAHTNDTFDFGEIE